MEQNITSYYEFSLYNKCPLLWKTVFIDNKKLSKQISYHDFIYHTEDDCHFQEGVSPSLDEQYIKANAIKHFLNIEKDKPILIDNIEYNKSELKEKELLLYVTKNNYLSLPIPEIYENENTIYIVNNLITSTNYNEYNISLLPILQKSYLLFTDKYKNKDIKLLTRHIQPSALKMKKAETDEEFEARKAELLKKSKTGTSKAQKQLGESKEEFYERYLKAIKICYYKENYDNTFLANYVNAIINKLNCFFRDKENPEIISFNNTFCKYCDFNSSKGCPCFSDNLIFKDGFLYIEKK